MKIHAVDPMELRTACGLQIVERLMRGESRIVARKGRGNIHASAAWKRRAHSDVTCLNCQKVMP